MSSGSEEDIFFYSVLYFCYIFVISPWIIAGPTFEQTCIPFTQKCFVQSLVENGPEVLEKEFKFSSIYFCYFIIISPLKRAGPSFEQPYIFATQIFWLKIFQWFSIKKNIFCQCIFTVSLLRVSSLEKRRDSSFETKRIFFAEECVVPNLVKIDLVMDGKTDGRTKDNSWSEKCTWSFIPVYYQDLTSYPWTQLINE